jgi:hypothetical protein
VDQGSYVRLRPLAYVTGNMPRDIIGSSPERGAEAHCIKPEHASAPDPSMYLTSSRLLSGSGPCRGWPGPHLEGSGSHPRGPSSSMWGSWAAPGGPDYVCWGLDLLTTSWSMLPSLGT